MFHSFRERRPWAAALVNLVFHPFLGMLYLGRGALALAYLAMEFVWAVLVLVFVAPAHWELGPQLVFFVAWFLPVGAIGAVHAAVIARVRPAGARLPRYSRWYVLAAIDLAFFLTAFAIRTFFYQPFYAPSTSMSPTLSMGDYFFVSKRPFEPERGDIVVYRGPEGDFVKRIVGLPGDRVQMVGGALVLNGRAVPRRRIEDYVGQDRFGVARPVAQYVEDLPSGPSVRTLDLVEGAPQDDTGIFVVPAGRYFVLGDNRDNSDDSRIGQGYIPRENIRGKVVVKFADRKHKTAIFESVR